MEESQNLANAIVIIGAVYFIQSGFNWWLLILIGFAIATWGIQHQTEDQKKCVKLHNQKIDADIKNLNAATAIAIANTKLIARRLGQ